MHSDVVRSEMAVDMHAWNHRIRQCLHEYAANQMLHTVSVKHTLVVIENSSSCDNLGEKNGY